MDPTRCLKELLDMLASKESDEREGILEHLEDLAYWINRGGFYPKVSKYPATITHKTSYKIGD